MTDTPTAAAAVAPRPERFNVARHLLECNAARHDRAAFVDDAGTLTYGELEDQVRRLAAGLRALGLRREDFLAPRPP